MRWFRRHLARAVLVPAGAAVLAMSAAPVRASAADELGGRTTVTTSPAVTAALLHAGVVPQSISPARERVIRRNGTVVRATFPITGGSLNGLSGDIMHSGGLTFVHAAAHRSLAITRFDIVLDSAPHITAEVPALHTRVTVFTLDLSRARVGRDDGVVTVDNVGVSLAPGVAGVLDSALATGVFSDRLSIGTARVVVERED